MTEQLPISIYACDEFTEQFTKITSVCNKLEAQFNFQAMTANWYCDEDNIHSIKLVLETSKAFAFYQTNQANNIIKNHSDDVFSYYDTSKEQQTIVCYIAITDSELAIIIPQPKLLAGFLRVKLKKVLNLIANDLTLEQI